MRKLPAQWIPVFSPILRSEIEWRPVVNSSKFATNLENIFWTSIITTDETWLPLYMPEEQSKQWCDADDHPPLRAKTDWDCDAIIFIDFLKKGDTINSLYFSSLLCNDLRTALKNRRRGKLSSRPLLQMDNARPHTVAFKQKTLEQLRWTVPPHPTSSPDLAPSDYHLFGNLKKPQRKALP